MFKWIHIKECQLCGKSFCVVDANDGKVGYCYYQQKVFFLNRDGLVYLTSRKYDKYQFVKEQRMSDLFYAVNSRAYAEIIKALREGQDINSLSDQGKTAVILAIENGDSVCLEILLESGADCNRKDSQGRIPLLLAIMKGEMKLVNSLLERGADVNSKDASGQIPIFMAIEKGNEVLVSCLLEKGAKINLVDEQGKSPLILAIESGNEKLALLLLEKGADVNYRDKEDKTPLFLAIEKESGPLVSALLERGADINITDAKGQTPLMLAIENNASWIPTLLEKGANVNVVDKEGKTPLFLAILKKNEALTSLLLEKGAEVNYKFQEQSLTDVAFSKGYYFLVTLLVKKGGILGGYSIVTAMKRMVEKAKEVRSIGKMQDYQIVKGLISEGVGLSATDEDGDTILHVLVKFYNAKLGYLLNLALQKGANPNIRDKKGRTPLYYAALGTNLGLIRLLIAHGANVNIADENMVTPYQLVTMLASVQVLLNAGKGEKEITIIEEKEGGEEDSPL